MRIPYAEWTVGDETYKLKLTTSDICKLEEMFNTSLLNLIGNGAPALSVMLKITHQAMTKFHHGKKLKDVQELFDQYSEEGGSHTSFMTDVFLPIYQASGFFSQAQAEQMEENLEDAKEQI